MRTTLLICAAVLVLAAAIVFHANTGRYQLAYSGDRLTYAKLDTRTGAAWFCGAGLDECIPMTNRAAFLAAAKRADSAEEARREGYSDEEIDKFLSEHKSTPAAPK